MDAEGYIHTGYPGVAGGVWNSGQCVGFEDGPRRPRTRQGHPPAFPAVPVRPLAAQRLDGSFPQNL